MKRKFTWVLVLLLAFGGTLTFANEIRYFRVQNSPYKVLTLKGIRFTKPIKAGRFTMLEWRTLHFATEIRGKFAFFLIPLDPGKYPDKLVFRFRCKNQMGERVLNVQKNCKTQKSSPDHRSYNCNSPKVNFVVPAGSECSTSIKPKGGSLPASSSYEMDVGLKGLDQG